MDPRALQWPSKDAAQIRYRQIVADIDFEGITILDVGCGFGDIIDFIAEPKKAVESDLGDELDSDMSFSVRSKIPRSKRGENVIKSKTKKFSYTGIDLVPEFIEVSKKKYPSGPVAKYKFIVGDYFGNPPKEEFDIVLTYGTLNANTSSPLNYRKNAIKIMFDHAKDAVSFNMAGGRPQPKNKKGSRVFYADSLKILSFCFKLTPRLIFRHHYRSNDFTIILFKTPR